MQYYLADKLSTILGSSGVSDRDYKLMHEGLVQIERDFQFLSDRITELERENLAITTAIKKGKWLKGKGLLLLWTFKLDIWTKLWYNRDY